MDLIITILPVVTKDFPISPRSRLTNFYRDASSAILQLVNQWLIFTYSRSHAFRYGRRKNTKSYFGKNRTHDFRTSRCAGYLLDHSGEYSGKKRHISKEKKKKKKGHRQLLGNCVSLSGAASFRECKTTKKNKKKKNVTPEKGDMASASPRGYNFSPLVANQLWRAKEHDHALLWGIMSLFFPVTFGQCYCMP